MLIRKTHKEGIQISRIAKQLNIQSSEVLYYLGRIGIETQGIMSKVNKPIYRKIVRHFEKKYDEIKASKHKIKPFEKKLKHIKLYKNIQTEENKNLKGNWSEFKKIIDQNNIKFLYHFTDKSNLESIKKHGGLLSWWYCECNGITIPKSASNDLSRSLDKKHGLENYVRLCFTKNHPMLSAAKYEINPVILCIDPEVIYLKETLFSNTNATANSAEVGGKLSDFKKIDIEVFNNPYWNEKTKFQFQAEVLVKEIVPLKFIKEKLV